jgi:addiction module RelB/DinJ family antitoxin
MATITVRVDDQLKSNFDLLCDMFGLSNSAALNLFMKAVVRERRIPFEIKAESDAEARIRGWEAFQRMRESVKNTDAADMTLDDINKLIKEARDERSSVRSN